MSCGSHPNCTNEYCNCTLKGCLHYLKIEAHVPEFAQLYSQEELFRMYTGYEHDKKKHPVLRFVLDHVPTLGLSSRDRHDIAGKVLHQQGQDLSLLEIV